MSIYREEGLWQLFFELLPQQMSQSKKVHKPCQHANENRQVVLETLSWTLTGILKVTYVTWGCKNSVRHHNKEPQFIWTAAL